MGRCRPYQWEVFPDMITKAFNTTDEAVMLFKVGEHGLKTLAEANLPFFLLFIY